MARSFPAELQLAAACAMWPPSDRRTEAIRAAATGSLDWPRFLRVAQRHWVFGLAHQGLTEARLAIPPEIRREISARAATLVRENLTMAAEALRLQRLFGEAHVPVLFVKGSSLAILAFGNLGLSGSQDIDLLVPREALPAATELIARAGYRRFDPPPGISDMQLRQLLSLRRDLGFVHQTTGLQIELHWRLFGNPHAMAEDSIMAASREVLLTDTMGLRTLGDEDLFAYLCMHGARHWWNRLKWLADFNALLASAPEDRIEHLVRTAEARGTGRAAVLALLLCRRLLGATLPAQLMATLGESTTIRWLQATALRAMATGQGERTPHETRFGTTLGTLSSFLLSRSWRYRLKELNLHLTNQTDMLTIPLPERLRVLYPLLRLPLWVWRHAAKPGSDTQGARANPN
jgi:Uncharacterised nucleotidyltransferase